MIYLNSRVLSPLISYNDSYTPEYNFIFITLTTDGLTPKYPLFRDFMKKVVFLSGEPLSKRRDTWIEGNSNLTRIITLLLLSYNVPYLLLGLFNWSTKIRIKKSYRMGYFTKHLVSTSHPDTRQNTDLPFLPIIIYSHFMSVHQNSINLIISYKHSFPQVQKNLVVSFRKEP